MAIPITAIIVFGIIVLAAMDNYYNLKKKKIDAELRMREMEAGVAPGTYSRLSKKELRKAKRRKEKDTFSEESQEERDDPQAEREALLKGIKDLKSRIDNIDTIISDKKAHKGENK